MNYKLEIIGFTVDGCKLAQTCGAHRIELCDNAAEGGTTPSYGFLKKARKILDIDLFPIIRPRGGDFLYTEDEFQIILEDIRVAKQFGCDGIVTGILNADGTVDIERMERICCLAYPLEVTFHRAFDRTSSPFEALESIIKCGCTRILTSGHAPHAPEGIILLKELVARASDRIIIMPGSGVNKDNIQALLETGAEEFHLSARKSIESKMEYNNHALPNDTGTLTVDKSEIMAILNILNTHRTTA